MYGKSFAAVLLLNLVAHNAGEDFCVSLAIVEVTDGLQDFAISYFLILFPFRTPHIVYTPFLRCLHPRQHRLTLTNIEELGFCFFVLFFFAI